MKGIWTTRHTSVAHFEESFNYNHLPENLQRISKPFSDLADLLLSYLHDGPELSVALRKLVEAKDCAVRQAVRDNNANIH